MENKTLEQLKEQYADYIATLSAEDKAKVEACKTVEELIALAQAKEGELPDDIAEAIAGGRALKGFVLWCGVCKTYRNTDRTQKGPFCGAHCCARHN